MKTRINTIDRAISENELSDVCKTVHYSFYKEKTVGEGDDIKEDDVKKMGRS